MSFYVFGKNKWQISNEWDMSLPHGAGAIVSTTADLNKYLHALFAGKLIETPDFIEILIPSERFQKMQGRYKSETHPLVIMVSGYEGKLFARTDGQGQLPLTAKSQSLFEFKDAGIEIKIEIEIDVNAKRYVGRQNGIDTVMSKE